ncbi:unnamed protein product [Brassica oleracea var. botrytis]|nr:unnamed protein product [Brassica oleracea]
MRSYRVKNCLDTSLTKLASGSLTINMTPRPLPSSLKFKACVLLSTFDSFEDDTLLMGGVVCRIMGKQNGLTVQYGSNQHHLPWRVIRFRDHLYIFEDSFCLKEDCPEAGEATLSELVFEFLVHGNIWTVKGCGVQLLFPGSRIDENAVDNVVDDDGNEVESDIKDDADKTQEGEESRHDDDAETRSKKRMRFCKGKISGLKVLVVPDYVDKIKQLGVIVKRLQWFGSGSSF